jgi:hypothetical protein
MCAQPVEERSRDQPQHSQPSQRPHLGQQQRLTAQEEASCPEGSRQSPGQHFFYDDFMKSWEFLIK